MAVVFESEACRVWTGALGAPLHAIEDAEQYELDFIPFGLQIWLKNQPNTASMDVQSDGLYLIKILSSEDNFRHSPPVPSLFLPRDALSCFSLYSPSPFVSTVLVVLDVDDTRQQGYFFGRVRRALKSLPFRDKTFQSSDQDSGAFYDTEVAEELLTALHTAFPKVHLSRSARDCLAKRDMDRRADGAKIGEMVKRRKMLSADTFYGPNVASVGSSDGCIPDSSWKSFYEKLQFRISHSLLCQLEGTAAISSSFPRQQEAFEFADQVAALRRRASATRGSSTYGGHGADSVPRVFSFESAGNGKRRFLVASFAEFWKNYKKTRADQRHVYEIIREGVPCRLYFDLEFKRVINASVDGNALVDRLICLLQLQFYRRYGIHVNQRDVYQLDSSTPAKFSRHLIFHLPSDSLFVNNLHAGAVRSPYFFIVITRISDTSFTITRGQFVREFISDLVAFRDEGMDQTEGCENLYTPFLVNTEREDDPVEKKSLFIDTGVYTRNRMFRVLGSSKFKKQASLQPLTMSTFVSDIDQELFLNTLVCPYPSLEAMEASKETKCPLLQCESSPTALARSQCLLPTRVKSLTTSSIDCRASSYPALDAFIRSQATNGGIQGEVRAIQMLMTNNSAMLANLPDQEQPETTYTDTQPYPWMIIYHMARNRWCANIQRPHKSNNVMFIVDIDQRVFYQKCHDPTCQAIDFRSPSQPLPSQIEFQAKADGSTTTSSHYGNT